MEYAKQMSLKVGIYRGTGKQAGRRPGDIAQGADADRQSGGGREAGQRYSADP